MILKIIKQADELEESIILQDNVESVRKEYDKIGSCFLYAKIKGKEIEQIYPVYLKTEGEPDIQISQAYLMNDNGKTIERLY